MIARSFIAMIASHEISIVLSSANFSSASTSVLIVFTSWTVFEALLDFPRGAGDNNRRVSVSHSITDSRTLADSLNSSPIQRTRVYDGKVENNNGFGISIKSECNINYDYEGEWR